jgi:hypothetical protein
MHRILDELAGDIVVLLILGGVGLLVAVKQWPEWFRRMRSAHWPTIPGTVESGGVSTYRTQSRYWKREIERATAQLAYSYRLDSTYYAGYHTETFNDEQKAWSYVDALKGQAVQVSYNPQKPDVSVLRQRLRPN